MKKNKSPFRTFLCVFLVFTLVLPVSPCFSSNIPDYRNEHQNLSKTAAPLSADHGKSLIVAQAGYPQGSKAGKWKTIVGSDVVEEAPPPPETEPGSQIPGPEPVGEETWPPPETEPEPVGGQIDEPPGEEVSGPGQISQSSEPVAANVGAQGAKIPWNNGAVQVSIPPGALNRNVSISVQESPIAFEKDSASSIGEEEVILAGASELGPSGTTFSNPVEVAMQLSPKVQGRLNQGHELVIAIASGDSVMQVKDYRVDDQGRVHFYMDHFTSAFVFALMGLGVIFLGLTAGRMIATDSPHIMIQPQHKDVQNFINSGKVKLPAKINQTGSTDLGIEKSFKGTLGVFKTINGGASMVKMKNGSKVNCQDLTFLAASILLGSGDPRFQEVIGVGGNASAGNYSGGHMWLEVKIDGQIYVVDTTDAGRLMLMPAYEAYKKYSLEPSFEFGHKSRRKNYVGWDGKEGADNFANPYPPSLPEPTKEDLANAYKDGKEMGCRHMSMSTDAIKEELRDVYGKIKHPLVKEKFREGYSTGAEKCKPK